MSVILFENVFATNIIYVASINVDTHRDCIKIGKASTTKRNPTQEDLEAAARERTNDYSRTLGIKVTLEWVEAAIRPDKNGTPECFMDYDVHSVLKRSGIKKKHFGTGASEWYQCSVETAKRAIAAVKNHQTTLSQDDVEEKWEPLSYRPEQLEAIEKTIDVLNDSDEMLWNAKMRFGKTVSALEVVKRMNVKRTLIFTHRPVVIDGWHKDFYKVFGDRLNHFHFGSKTLGKTYEELESHAANYIYFASLQDLRGSEEVGGNFDKNNELFATPWDLLIVDEAHEGTLTLLGENVLKALRKERTKVLRLSGTPYNLLEKFDSNAVYTWDYTMEQKAKQQWENEHPDEPNPYAILPTMNIYTYDLARLMSEGGEDEVADVAFNFREFFRTDGDYDRFLHETDVKRFLDLLVSNDVQSLYPYSNELFQGIFRHTLWMLPGVKAARALSKLLKDHPVFSGYTIVNVAGEGDEEEEAEEALAKLETAITKHPERTKTITLSCGRLTTGVTVPAWTGVFMLSGSAKTSASSYMQTIFRVQSPGSIGGLMKEQCYVFDFAPDRALQVLAETNHLQNFKTDGTSQSDRDKLGEFLNFCPVIAMDGSDMKPYSVDTMLRQLKRVFIERVVQSGFDDIHIFDKATFRRLSADELSMFDKLQKIIGKTKALPKTKAIDVNHNGLTDEEYETAKRAEEEKKEGRKLTEEQKAALEKLNQQRKQEEIASSILRGISIRMPLMVYGAELKNEAKELDIDNFTNLVDDDSWAEFMPKGVTKEMFNEFKQYFDREIFTGASMQIRQLVHEADNMNIEERIEQITAVFSYFRNPDKETVLTPWRVVNMHLGDTIGGHVFYDNDYSEPPLFEPRFADHGEVTQQVFSPESRVLEINSKSGLYPLYVAYSIYRTRRQQWEKTKGKLLSHSEQQNLWYNVLKDNVFVLCMTPMAAAITRRTLAGFHRVVVNAKYYPNLINEIKNNEETLISTVCQGKTFWRTNNDDNMKFNAVVGNPPYQIVNKGNGAGADPIYHFFIDIATILGKRSTLIHPARFLFNAGKTPKEWNQKMLQDEHFKVIKYYAESIKVFPSVDIKGGIAITLYDKNAKFPVIGMFSPHEEMVSIVIKVSSRIDFKSFKNFVYARDLYRLTDILYKENPWAEGRQSEGHKFDVGSPIFRVLPELFYDTCPDDGKDYIQIYGLEGKDRCYKWVRRDYIKLPDNIGKYKIFIPKANGNGGLNDVLSSPIVGMPNIGHSDTFMSIGCFETYKEAENCLKYIKTKFARLLLASLKVTHINPSSVWANIPLQDFTPQSDIDWSVSVAEIDQQLYRKYGLTPEEQAFIERMIKPME